MVIITKILITGAGGFIGHHLIRELSNKYEIVAITRTELKKELVKDNVFLKKYDLFECKSDIFKGVDIIIHTAGTSVNNHCFESNFTLTKKILDSILQLESNLPIFIFLSSYAVYGNRTSPAKETDSINPEDDYALSKVLCEILINYYSSKFKLKTYILRLGGVYGDGGKGIVNKIINSINKKEVLSITGMDQKRNFVYVKDVCKIISQLIEMPIDKIGVYNIGSDKNITIEELLANFKHYNTFKIEKFNIKDISYMIDNAKIKTISNYRFLDINQYFENKLYL